MHGNDIVEQLLIIAEIRSLNGLGVRVPPAQQKIT